MDKLELKSCPFCGGKAKYKTAKYNELGSYGNKEDDKQWHGVYCTKCKIGQPRRVYFTKIEAYDAWNNRV